MAPPAAPFAPQLAPQAMGGGPAATTGSFAPMVMGGPAAAPPGGTTGSFAPMVMGGPTAAPPGGTTGSFAPMVMGGPAAAPPAGTTGSFAPMVMGGQAAAPGGTTGSFAPMVMGGQAAAPPYAPLAATPFLSPVAPPGAAPVAPPAMGAPFAGPAGVPVDNGGYPLAPAGAPVSAQPAMGTPSSSGAKDDDLAASPWNTANNPGFNRDLLPSAMLAPPPEPAPTAKRAAVRPEAAGEESSRTPWIIVGVLVLVAIASGVAVFQIRGRHGKDGQIAVPAGGTTATDDAPVEPAPSASVPAAVRVVPTVRPIFRPRPTSDDPYAEVPSRPSGVNRAPPPVTPAPAATPTTAPHRIFGTEN